MLLGSKIHRRGGNPHTGSTQVTFRNCPCKREKFPCSNTVVLEKIKINHVNLNREAITVQENHIAVQFVGYVYMKVIVLTLHTALMNHFNDQCLLICL